MITLTEADVESAALDWLTNLGWRVAHGLDIAQIPPPPSAQTTPRSYWNAGCGTPSPR